MCFRIGELGLNIVEDFGGTLTRAHNDNPARSSRLGDDAVDMSGILRRVDDARVLQREALGKRRLSSSCHQHVTPAVRLSLASGKVLRLNGKCADRALFAITGRDRGYLLPKLNQVREERRAPSHVIFVLDTSGQESAQIGEIDQTALLVEVIQKGELGPGVSQRGQVLDKGDLHLRSGKQHARVPCEPGLLLNKENLGG